LDSGFFYVVDHGVSQEFMDEVFFQSKKFFDLPMKEKMKVLRNEKNRGYTPLLDEILDPDNQINGNYCFSMSFASSSFSFFWLICTVLIWENTKMQFWS
jgi:isopenicillin N synthase-like dioxygenase